MVPLAGLGLPSPQTTLPHALSSVSKFFVDSQLAAGARPSGKDGALWSGCIRTQKWTWTTFCSLESRRIG